MKKLFVVVLVLALLAGATAAAADYGCLDNSGCPFGVPCQGGVCVYCMDDACCTEGTSCISGLCLNMSYLPVVVNK
jgi:hypothetical protein